MSLRQQDKEGGPWRKKRGLELIVGIQKRRNFNSKRKGREGSSLFGQLAIFSFFHSCPGAGPLEDQRTFRRGDGDRSCGDHPNLEDVLTAGFYTRKGPGSLTGRGTAWVRPGPGWGLRTCLSTHIHPGRRRLFGDNRSTRGNATQRAPRQRSLPQPPRNHLVLVGKLRPEGRPVHTGAEEEASASTHLLAQVTSFPPAGYCGSTRCRKTGLSSPKRSRRSTQETKSNNVRGKGTQVPIPKAWMGTHRHRRDTPWGPAGSFPPSRLAGGTWGQVLRV